jgi:hypothetical protein
MANITEDLWFGKLGGDAFYGGGGGGRFPLLRIFLKSVVEGKVIGEDTVEVDIPATFQQHCILNQKYKKIL